MIRKFLFCEMKDGIMTSKKTESSVCVLSFETPNNSLKVLIFES